MALTVIFRGQSRPAMWRSLREYQSSGPNGQPPAENGDSYFTSQSCRPLPGLESQSGWLFSVADGLGGEGNDDIASQTAVRSLETYYTTEPREAETPIQLPSQWFQNAYARVNVDVCEERRRRGVPGMYTTLSSVLIIPDATESLLLYPANIGDSRIYLLRDSNLIQLTKDDGEDGLISRVIGDPNLFVEPYLKSATTVARTPAIESQVLATLEATIRNLLPEVSPSDSLPLASVFLSLLEGMCPVDLAPAYSRPLAILYEGLGAQRFRTLVSSLAMTYGEVAARLAPIPLKDGDRLMLCSDGISNAFSEAVLRELLSATPADSEREPLDLVIDQLLRLPGQVDDDRTTVLLRITLDADRLN